MSTSRSLQLFSLASVMTVAACERPTGPELLAKMDQAQADFLSDTTGERLLSQTFAGSWHFIGLLPNGQVTQNLVANIDGGDHRFKAFVFERVAVRLDPHDGYPCPLTVRSLLAIERGHQALFVRGSDFSHGVGERWGCGPDRYPGGGRGISPWVRIDRLSAKSVGGISGTARIDDAGKTGDCAFLRMPTDFPKVDCELRDYIVQLAVQTGLPGESIAQFRGSLTASPQRLPGLRLVLHCSQKDTYMDGCEGPSFFRREPH